MTAAARLGVVFLFLAAHVGRAAAQDARAWPGPRRDPPAGLAMPEGTDLEQTLRPMTLPRLALRADLGFVVAAPPVSAIDPRTAAALGIGAGLGVTDDVELSVSVLPLRVVPDVAYLNPLVAGTLRFLHTPTLQLGLTATVYVPARSPLQASVAGRLWIALSRTFQLRTTVAYTGDVTTAGATAYAHTASAAVDLLFQPHPSFYAVLGTGVAVPLPGTAWVDVLKSVAIGLGAEVGVAVPGPRTAPAADFFVAFSFPELFVPGADGNKVLTQPYVLTVGLRLFFTV